MRLLVRLCLWNENKLFYMGESSDTTQANETNERIERTKRARKREKRSEDENRWKPTSKVIDSRRLALLIMIIESFCIIINYHPYLKLLDKTGEIGDEKAKEKIGGGIIKTPK